jgi:hypothetical protein
MLWEMDAVNADWIVKKIEFPSYSTFKNNAGDKNSVVSSVRLQKISQPVSEGGRLRAYERVHWYGQHAAQVPSKRFHVGSSAVRMSR